MTTTEILDVVRASSSWEQLKKYGVMLSDNEWRFPAPSSEPVIICVQDVVDGYNQYQGDENALKSWASFLLAASDLISFQRIEDGPNGDQVIGALWDVAFGVPGASAKLQTALGRRD